MIIMATATAVGRTIDKVFFVAFNAVINLIH